MKKVFVVLLISLMLFGFVACDNGNESSSAYKVGMVCIGDENMAYDRNFYAAADEAKKILSGKGIEIEWVYKKNEPVNVGDYNEELAEDGCIAVFNNSYGMEPAMLTVAKNYPDTYFISMTNESSKSDDLINTINAMPSIHEARYLAGVAAGMKLQEMIDKGEIKANEAVMGYVGAYHYAEVISGYTAFYLGAKSVCPSVTMLVKFIGSWGDPSVEAATAQDLIDSGAILVSQHSDAETPAEVAEKNGVYHVGYNISMSDIAPNASIISSNIDWTNYFVYVIESIVNKTEIVQDYFGYGLKTGEVKVTTLNTKIAAKGTQEKLDEITNKIIDGSLQVFDTTTFTINGSPLTSLLIDMNADFVGDNGYDAVFDNAYHEAYFKSAPAFDKDIDGITLLN